MTTYEMYSFRFGKQWFFALFFAFFSSYSSAKLTDTEAMSEAGEQRMLSQRIAKAWLMLGQGVNPVDAASELDTGIARFEKHFLDLQEYAPNAKIQNSIDKVETVWASLRIHLMEKPNRVRANILIIESEKLLQASETLAKNIEDYTNIHESKILNLAARQKMLSQRMAKLYMAEAWGVKNSDLKNKMVKAIDEFDSALQILMKNPMNTATLKKQLSKVKSQWEFSRMGFNLEKEGRYVPTIIAVSSESILKKMDAINKQYSTIMHQKFALK